MTEDRAARDEPTAERAPWRLIARIALCVGLLTDMGFATWAFFFGTLVQLDVPIVTVWPLILAATLADRQSRQRYVRWLAAGMMLLCSSELIVDLAHEHHWQAGQLNAITTSRHWIAGLAMSCFVLGIFTGIRSGALRSLRSAVHRPKP